MEVLTQQYTEVYTFSCFSSLGFFFAVFYFCCLAMFTWVLRVVKCTLGEDELLSVKRVIKQRVGCMSTHIAGDAL